jgi:hypothetical protein
MTDRELMQMALDALEEYKNVVTSSNDHQDFGGVVDGGEPARDAIKALRDRLAQPEPKPCETGSQCIGGKCPECETDDEMCENCDCWKKTREMCS